MDRFCGRCGAPLDAYGNCPNCNPRQPSRRKKQVGLRQQERNRKRLIVILSILGGVLFLTLTVILAVKFTEAARSKLEKPLYEMQTRPLEEVKPEIPVQTEKEEPEQDKAPAMTEAPETEPPKTEPPKTEPPETEPPKTEPPETEAPEAMPSLKRGDLVMLGTYPQWGDDPQPLEWIVLDVQQDRALLLSRFGLDSKKYHDVGGSVTWEYCTLRQWLNEEFYDQAFSAQDQQLILETEVTADPNPRYDVDPGDNTYDQVFLLSFNETEYYLPTDQDRLCYPTSYAVMQGAYEKGGMGGCWWWLRTPGESRAFAGSINSDGSVDYATGSVNSPKAAVRPAIWVRVG